MKLDVDVLKLKEYYDSIENKIKTDAVVSRAYTDRLSTILNLILSLPK